MIVESSGIVFRTIKYSETSIISDIYTRDHGLISCIVSGVRKSKAKMHANIFQIMSIIDLVYYESPNPKSLRRIREAKPAILYERIPFDINRLTIGQFITEVLQKVIKEREANEVLFDFLVKSFRELDEMPSNRLPYFHLQFLINLSQHLGFLPQLDWSEENPRFDLMDGTFRSDTAGRYYLTIEESRSFAELLRSRSHKDELMLTREQRSTLLTNILLFYKLHVENFPEIQSLEILRQIYSN